MVSKGRHQANEINTALKRLPSMIAVDARKNGHTWGRLECTVCGDSIRINSTPQNPGSHAAKLLAWAANHTHNERKEA